MNSAASSTAVVNPTTLDSARAELIRLERMVMAQRELVEQLTPRFIKRLLPTPPAKYGSPWAPNPQRAIPSNIQPRWPMDAVLAGFISPEQARHAMGCFYYSDSCFQHPPDALPFDFELV